MDLSTVKQQFGSRDGAVMKTVVAGLLVLVLGVFVYVAYSGYRTRVASFGEVSAGSTDPSTRPEAGPHSPASPSDPGAQVPPPESGGETSEPSAHSSTATRTASPSDTISPNPPNGMTFGGSGHFQLYRQGDLTWRLNTESGETCILFATNEEWRQPRVRKAACSKSRRP